MSLMSEIGFMPIGTVKWDFSHNGKWRVHANGRNAVSVGACQASSHHGRGALENMIPYSPVLDSRQSQGSELGEVPFPSLIPVRLTAIWHEVLDFITKKSI